MRRYAAFLRGVMPVNAKMPELKAAFEAAGYKEVKTVLSSGNVVFSAAQASEASLEQKAEAAMQRQLGREFLTIIRPLDTLREILDSDPYERFGLASNAKRIVTFLRGRPPSKLKLPIEVDGARILEVKGGEVFSAYVPSPNGPIFMTLIAKTFGKEQTTRTWDTVVKVARAASLIAVLAFAMPVSAQSASRTANDSFSVALEVPSQGALLRGRIRVAAGAGPHATIVVLQGFPGQADPALPAYLQAAGFNGVALNFRGQWTSAGQYSVEGTLADARAMVGLLRSDSARRAFRVDARRIVLVGASAGTLAALRTTADDPGLRCVVAIVPFNWAPAAVAARSDTAIHNRFDRVVRAVTTGNPAPIRTEGLVERVLTNAESYDLNVPAAALRDRAVFLVGAAQDETAVLPIHFAPLVRAVQSAPGARLRDTLVSDGHNLPNTYLEVFAALVRWLRADCFRS